MPAEMVLERAMGTGYMHAARKTSDRIPSIEEICEMGGEDLVASAGSHAAVSSIRSRPFLGSRHG